MSWAGLGPTFCGIVGFLADAQGRRHDYFIGFKSGSVLDEFELLPEDE